ncbi:MAG: RT0821/Lpp0805 family surface protein [Pseudomonadota bacterium]
MFVVSNSHRDGFEALRRAVFCAPVLAAAVLISGCAVNGNAIDNAGLTSSTMSMAEPTPTISPNPFEPREGDTPGATDRLLDEDTLRLAVTTLDLTLIPEQGASWANAATGTSGRIINVSERDVAGQKCRSFEATRRSYDGISLYVGELCLDPRDGWWTRSLTNLSEPVQQG